MDSWTEQHQAEWSAWVQGRPPAVAAAITRLVPNPAGGLCVRQPTTGGHYWVEAWTMHPDDTVTVRATHLADSFLPGVQVFGIPEAELEACGRGDAKEPTVVDGAMSAVALELQRVAAMALAAAAGQQWDALTPAERRGYLFPEGGA